MKDYTYYIDFNAIKLGDLANSLGDYKCALENLSKALKKLKSYPGDKLTPAVMAGEISKKIDNIKNRNDNGTPIFKFDYWKLTKTSFVKGNQCEKYLFLDKHKKKEKTPFSQAKKILFKRGHNFEDSVRDTAFPNGINVKDSVGNFAYFNSYTKYLLNTKAEAILYEATIIEDEVLVMCDILEKDKNGLIDLYEIKLNTKLNDAIVHDLSIQYNICKKRFGEKINSFNVILRTDTIGKKWSIHNLKQELEDRQEETENKIKAFKHILQNNEPEIPVGDQCNTPYKCEFIDYCNKKKR